MGTRAIWETLYLSKVILLGHMVTGCNKEDRQPREALGWSWNNLQGGQSQLVQIQPVWVPAARLWCGWGAGCRSRWHEQGWQGKCSREERGKCFKVESGRQPEQLKRPKRTFEGRKGSWEREAELAGLVFQPRRAVQTLRE